MIKLKLLLIPEIFENKPVKEVINPAVILGAIWPDGEIRSINGMSDAAKHPIVWLSCNRWRYVPELKYLTWWEEPSNKEVELVKYYLESKGYVVDYCAVLTRNPFKGEI